MHAFDSVAWPFLIKLLRHVGFPNGCINWVSVLLSTVSTHVLLNGSPGSRICHAGGGGLRQGDPLLPMLFLLVMEVLHTLIYMLDQWSLF
jgi:hypothetical protein